jgi:predicted unusual protein kinase regulating ubiquinone biosynthesis (AarF/ABC1/UbiB family)
MSDSFERSSNGSPIGDAIRQGRVRRSAPLARLAARTAGEAVVAGLRRKISDADPLEFHARTAERYAELLGHSKGVLMKAGQMVSFVSCGPVVPTEFRSVYQTALSRLQGDAPPMHPELARATLEQELGRRAEDAFAEFDWAPLAAASIGQVHAARLDDGRRVAVKIQYPGVAEAIRSDLENTELLATFFALISAAMPGRTRLDLRGGAREVSARITEELDYRLEATNQREFAEIYRDHPFIHVPEVIRDLSTGRVLTQELVTGRSWLEALSASQELRNRWGEAIYRFCWGTLQSFGLFNADPHPGNYLFHDDGTVSFLDFGCVKRFRSGEIGLMNSVWSAALDGDAHAIWHAAVEGGLFRSSDDLTPADVLAYWREGAEYCWGSQPFTITPEYVAACIERECSPTGPSGKTMRQLAAPGEFAFMLRIDLGLMSVLGELRAASDWASIEREHRLGAAPSTPLGRLDREFFQQHPARRQHA